MRFRKINRALSLDLSQHYDAQGMRTNDGGDGGDGNEHWSVLWF